MRPSSFQTRPKSSIKERSAGRERQAISVMVGGQFEFIALLGQRGEFLMRAEIVRRSTSKRLLPTSDALRQRPVDILKGLFRRWRPGRFCEYGRRCGGPAACCLVS